LVRSSYHAHEHVGQPLREEGAALAGNPTSASI